MIWSPELMLLLSRWSVSIAISGGQISFRGKIHGAQKSIGKDATSKETLEDLEENEKYLMSSDDASLPSPDGSFDDPNE